MNYRKFRNRILGPYRLAHHPLCTNFEKHVFRIQGKKVCRGCLMQYLGIIFAFIVILANLLIFQEFNWSDFQIGILLYLLIFPTIITAFLIENRLVKDIARFMLGVAFSIALTLVIFVDNWIVKGFILLNLLPGYYYLQKRREEKNEEICKVCNEYEHLPYCTGFQVLTDREKIFTSQILQGGIIDPFSLPPEKLEE